MNKLNIQPISNVLIAGKTRSGKTYTFKYIFKDLARNYDYGICFCSTADLNDDYDFLPDKYVHGEYDEELIETIIEKQTKYIKKYGKKKSPKVFIILDDAIGMVKFHHSKIWDSLFSKSRHLNIAVFILIQHMKYLTPCMRINTGYLLITKIADNNLETAYEMTTGFSSKRQFREYLDKWCINFNTILIDNNDVYNSKPQVFRAPKDLPKFRLEY